jgi:ABC-2 type transport system permease protein
LVLGLVILTVGLVIAKVVSVPILGNIFLIYGFTSIYLIILELTAHLIIIPKPNKHVHRLVLFVIFILMSGLFFTPIEIWL